MKFRKKPVVIEAFKYDGDFCDRNGKFYIPEWAEKAYLEGTLFFSSEDEPGACYVNTLEGDMKANVGDYIIQGVQGEIYPCKPDIFEATYEKVKEK